MSNTDIPLPPEPQASAAEAPAIPKVPSAAEMFPDFLKEVDKNRTGEPISIGFPLLQGVIRNALIKGLICIGAAPSAGKTAFIMQMAYNIASAKNGARDVLIFALEMPRNELIARDISRITYMLKRINPNIRGEAKTTAEILSGTVYDNSGNRVNFSENDKSLLNHACDTYKRVAERIYIYESNEELTADKVSEIARNFTKEHNGEPPVIFIDYLQLLSPPDTRSDERRTNTHNTVVFKNLSKDIGGKGTTVFAISATARANYYESDPEGFGKESGGIEYTADATLFMQYAPCFDNYTAKGRTEADRIKNKENAAKAEAAKDDREIIVSVIKNRAGRRNQYIKYTYHAKYNTYDETGAFYRNFREHEKQPTVKSGKKKRYEEDGDTEAIEL